MGFKAGLGAEGQGRCVDRGGVSAGKRRDCRRRSRGQGGIAERFGTVTGFGNRDGAVGEERTAEAGGIGALEHEQQQPADEGECQALLLTS
ncbi:MAG TPA: hypothetical protein DD491_03485 [Halieaceae bacterium]|nr:hypothetical protein [Halieaceae bacterium]